MDLDWLSGLEDRIHQATEELRRLRQENTRLNARVEELEAELDGADGDSGANAWRLERDEIRQRVERLAEGLEELLEDDDTADEDDEG
jgi:predicted  nucleic acid-binding Zn-ribbon protein